MSRALLGCLINFHPTFVLYLLYSCLIARNLLNGLKSCWEVFQYMNYSEKKLAYQAGNAANLEGYSKFEFNGIMVSFFPALLCTYMRSSHLFALPMIFCFFGC